MASRPISNRKLFMLFLFLLALFTGYLTLGALGFKYLESSFHADNDKEAVKLVKQFTTKYNCTNETELLLLIHNVTGLTYGHSIENTFNVSGRWESFHETFFLSATIVTTIGYGDMVPKTDEGRWFCILYACVGIPITAVFVSHIGTIFVKVWKVCFQYIIRNVLGKNGLDSPPRFNRICTTLLLSILTCVCLISLPAWALTVTEDWTVNESYYFCFISLSTIGFGDYVAGQSDLPNVLPLMRYLTIVYLILGLSVLSAVFKVLVEYNTNKMKKLTYTAQTFIKRKARTISLPFNKKRNDDNKVSVENEFNLDVDRFDSERIIRSISYNLTANDDVETNDNFDYDKSTQTCDLFFHIDSNNSRPKSHRQKLRKSASHGDGRRSNSTVFMFS